MTEKSGDTKDHTQQNTREERLKAALKSNLQRRKSQARARKTSQAPQAEQEG